MSKSSSELVTAAAGVPRPRFDLFGSLNRRAVLRGALVGAGGSLAMVSWIGFVAVIGMAAQRLPPERMLDRLQSAWDIRLLVLIANVLMSMLAGYTAAQVAGIFRRKHALASGAGTAAVNLLLLLWIGSPLPAWLAGLSLILVIPLAAVGGFLAEPSTRGAPSGG